MPQCLQVNAGCYPVGYVVRSSKLCSIITVRYFRLSNHSSEMTECLDQMGHHDTKKSKRNASRTNPLVPVDVHVIVSDAKGFLVQHLVRRKYHHQRLQKWNIAFYDSGIRYPYLKSSSNTNHICLQHCSPVVSDIYIGPFILSSFLIEENLVSGLVVSFS